MSNLNEVKLKTIIKTNQLYANEYIKGICSLNDINLNKNDCNILIYIKTNCIKNNLNISYVDITLQKLKLKLNQSLIEGGLTIVPFKFKINHKVPVSIHKSNVWIETYLKENNKQILKEKYNIVILPPQYIEHIIKILEKKGFLLKEVYTTNNNFEFKQNNFFQCFKFENKKNYNNIKKIDIIFIQKNNFIELYINNIKVLLKYKYVNNFDYLNNKINLIL